MNWKRIIAVAGLAIGLIAGPQMATAGVHLVRSGKPASVIVVPDNATGGEKYAARELQDYVRQISGAELPVTCESSYSDKQGARISVGRTKLSENHVSDSGIAELGDDGYCIFTSNDDTFFVGGRKRGSLYAVYDYLESLGVRWYSPEYTVVPKKADLDAPSNPRKYIPKLWYRAQWWNNAPTLEWLTRMRVNGNNGQTPQIPESMGGCVKPMYGCHSFEILVPAAVNFDKHREWYALKENGERSRGELCLTNPELREFVTSKVLDDLTSCSGAVENYWVSQNDGGQSGCFCEKCTAERAAHGGKDRWSANIVAFVSKVADGVKPRFPKVRIKSLAYSYTQQAPEKMKASDNVLIEICGNFKADETSHALLVKSWFETASNISVYTYGGSNYGYWWPFPNLHELGMQYPRAAENGVTAFYVQGTALGKGSGFGDLRAYLTARLAWDPTRDVDKEIAEFCHGFYGPAAPFIIDYINWYTEYVKEHQMVLYDGWGDENAWRQWVTAEATSHSEKLFQKALDAAKDNPTYLKHVRRTYLEVLWAEVMLALEPTKDNKPVFVPGADVPTIRSKAKLFVAIMRENHFDKLAEYLPYEPGKNLIDAVAR